MKPIDPQWAWEPYRPSAEAPWDLQRVGHLFRRATFGATHAQLRNAVKAGPEKTIEQLLEGEKGLDGFDAETNALAESVARVNNGLQLRDWWLYRMLYSPHPLREKLTLFWHNQFATSNSKVKNAEYMLGQYRLLRKHA